MELEGPESFSLPSLALEGQAPTPSPIHHSLVKYGMIKLEIGTLWKPHAEVREG